MESILGTLILVFILIWAFRLEINTSKTRETLERIEKKLNEGKKGNK